MFQNIQGCFWGGLALLDHQILDVPESFGWVMRTTQSRPLLPKFTGSLMVNKFGIHAAQRLLRHTSPTITSKFESERDSHDTTLPGIGVLLEANLSKASLPTEERGNSLNYAFDAARIMNDPDIKKQVKAHWRRLQEEIAKPLE